MPYSKARGVCLLGVEGFPITVEVHIGRGPSCLVMSGLPDAALGQSKVRIRSAFENSGLAWPDAHTVVNLLPATLPKAGSGCDLAIATALLAATSAVPEAALATTVMLGELGLDGRVRPVRGVLPALLGARADGAHGAVVPAENLAEAALAPDMQVYAATDLSAVVDHLRGEAELPRALPPAQPGTPPRLPDLNEVVGQEAARRALEVAAAGGHHMFLLGPPGAGKTLLAERLPSILPPLDEAAALECTALHSVAEALPREPTTLQRHPPFCAPHHSATTPAMVGGGSNPLRPGAISRAHNGVLFLDESPEFRREVLDALRQPLECGEILLSRAQTSARFPADVQLILAANPCPCAAASRQACSCPSASRRRYLGRLSGPLLDRVDIRVEVAPLPMSALHGAAKPPESSSQVAARVATARAAAKARWSAGGEVWQHNSQATGPRLRAAPWRLPPSATAPADRLVDTQQLTGRGYDRVLRLAWSLADLAGRDRPDADDVGEAAGLRIGHRLLA